MNNIEIQTDNRRIEELERAVWFARLAFGNTDEGVHPELAPSAPNPGFMVMP